MERHLEKILSFLIYFPLWVYFNICGRSIIKAEAINWGKILTLPNFKSGFHREIWLLSHLSEFRTLLYYRYNTFKFNLFKIVYPGTPNLYLPCSQKIGSGLVIQHGYSTIFNAEVIGDNCQVWQGVTIGKAHSGPREPRPVIGNNVKICCHSVVLGNITIGDNVTIGAGTIITKSIPSNCIVVGNPARIISREGKRVDMPL